MESSQTETPSLKTLIIFENTIKKELIRSLHVYRSENGGENEVEREFLFKRGAGPYVEMAAVAPPLLRLQGFRPHEIFEGKRIGLWLCVFAYNVHRLPRLFAIPFSLSISRNPKLESIPTLASDLQMIFQRGCVKEPSTESYRKKFTSDVHRNSQKKISRIVLDQDLNSVATSESQQTKQSATAKKRKRADAKDVAAIALEDLAKHFGLPMEEASRNLNIGVTLLKKKCREFGISSWPHRKIKSLDSLIRDLQAKLMQEEAEKQQQLEDEVAATAVSKRQMLLETEKESIEKEPIIEIKRETKRFRKDVWNRKYRARARNNRHVPDFLGEVNEIVDYYIA